MTEKVKVSDIELRCLRVLYEHSYGGEQSLYFRSIAKETGLDLKQVRRPVRSLARKGLAEYTRGLFDDDGQVAGSGYAITRAGDAFMEELLEREQKKADEERQQAKLFKSPAWEGAKILDACCGGRMFWFNKKHPSAVYIDNRTLPPTKLSNGATLEVKPDLVMDFRHMEFPDDTFFLVVFDPPQVLRAGKKSFLATKYGHLEKDTWQDDLRQGFAECFRVLRPNGVLVFKWNEMHIPIGDVLALTPVEPLFGNRNGKASKTHWITFMKP